MLGAFCDTWIDQLLNDIELSVTLASGHAKWMALRSSLDPDTNDDKLSVSVTVLMRFAVTSKFNTCNKPS